MTASSDSPGRGSSLGWRLRVTGATFGRDLLFVGRLVVGRSASCDISANDERLSRRHAEFDATGARPVVRDLGSSNGVKVNGRRTAQATLVHGDVIDVGGFQITFFDDGASADAVATVRDTMPAGHGDETILYPSNVVGRGRAGEATGVADRQPPADETLLMPRPVIAAPPPAAPASSPQAESKPARTGRSAWGSMLLVTNLTAAIAIWLAVALPLLATVSALTPGTDPVKAQALASWIASEYQRAPTAGEALVARVESYSGIEQAVIVAVADSTVVAPAALAGRRVDKLPFTAVAAADIVESVQFTRGDVIAVALPVERDGVGSRVVVLVATRGRPAPMRQLVGAALAAVPVALIIAVMVTSRAKSLTGTAVRQLQDDMELCLTSRHDRVADPFGLPSSEAFCDVLLYAAQRSGGAEREPAARRPPRARSAPADSGPVPSADTDMVVVVNAMFGIQSASPATSRLLNGLPDEMTGRHIADSIRDDAVANAALAALSGVRSGKTASRTVPGFGDFPRGLAIEARQTPDAGTIELHFRSVT